MNSARTPQKSGTQDNKKKVDIIYKGIVNKESGGAIKSWKKRYMELYSVRSQTNDLDIRVRFFQTEAESQAGKEAKVDLSVKGTTFRESELKKKPFCLKICFDDQHKKQNFYFCAENEDAYFNWKDHLLNSGVGHGPKEISKDNPEGRLQNIDVKDWTEQDVYTWLNCVRLEDDETGEAVRADSLYKDFFKAARINGHKLIELQRASLQSMGVDNPKHIRQILTGILLLKKERYFNLNKHRVFEKFEKMKKGEQGGVDFQDLEMLVESLSDVKLLKEVYLNTKALSEEELKRYYNYEKEDGDSDIANGEQTLSASLQQQQSEVKFAVKLIITEITRSAATKNVRKLLSPIMALVPNFTNQYGLFHTALIVGPWYLEWNDSSFCIPRKMASSMALLSADLPPLVIPSDKLGDVADRLGAVIVNWNVNYVYNNRKKVGEEIVGKQRMGNCQHFVDSLLRCLNINPQFKGALNTFLSDMKDKGTCEMAFKPDDNFRKKYKLENTSYQFKTHEELDIFVNQLNSTCATFKMDNEGEYALLKSFDRAFWLRHLKNPNDPTFRPKSKHVEMKGEFQEVCDCPFQDPRVTGSFAGQKQK